MRRQPISVAVIFLVVVLRQADATLEELLAEVKPKVKALEADAEAMPKGGEKCTANISSLIMILGTTVEQCEAKDLNEVRQKACETELNSWDLEKISEILKKPCSDDEKQK